MSRRLAREKIMQCLFSITVGNNAPEEAIELFDDDELTEQDQDFAKGYILEIIEHLKELDALYKPYLKDWQLERLANVDRTLLRMAVYEMRYKADIPVSVTINEAVELAKVFGSDESSKFVNAVLDNLRKETTKENEEHEVPRD